MIISCIRNLSQEDFTKEEVIAIINVAPAAELATAQWIDVNPEEYLDPRMKCSKCGSIETPLAIWNYCLYCGAKMKNPLGGYFTNI